MLSRTPQRWLIVTQYYPPEPGAAQIRLSTFAKLLKERGLDVEVFTGLPNYPTGTIPEAYRGKWTHREIQDEIPVNRTWIYGFGGKNKLLRVLNFFSFTFSALFNLFRLKRPDVVFLESQPLPVGILGLISKYLWGVPYIYNIPDMQIEVAEQMGWTKNQLVLGAARFFENTLMKQSWKVSTVTKEFIEYFHRERGIPRNQLTLLPNGADTRTVRPLPYSEEMANRFGVQGKKVFVYAGTHAHYHRLETIIEAAERIHSRDDIRIVMVGRGPSRQQIMDLAAAKRLKNIIFGEAPIHETSQLMSICTAALVVLRNAPVSSKMRLAKTFPPMACGKPVLFSGEGESAELISSNQCGLVCPPEDSKGLADLMVKLADDPELARVLGQNALHFLKSELDWTLIVERWLKELSGSHLLKLQELSV